MKIINIIDYYYFVMFGRKIDIGLESYEKLEFRNSK